ncbi:MAG: molybdate ABC transporter permease subunit, partial [Lysinibacillus sp.]
AFWAPIKLSLTVTITAGTIVIIVGTFFGYLFAKKRFKGKVILETMFMLPLVLPPSVIGFLLIIIFGNQSIVGEFLKAVFGHSIIFTWYAAVIAATVVAFPLMFQTAKAGFQGVAKKFEEAAQDLGATKLQVFFFISLPLAKRALSTGAILSCARALGEFGATLMFAGNIPGVTQTVPTAIYMAIDRGDMVLAWAWVIVILVLSYLLLLFTKIKTND